VHVTRALVKVAVSWYSDEGTEPTHQALLHQGP